MDSSNQKGRYGEKAFASHAEKIGLRYEELNEKTPSIDGVLILSTDGSSPCYAYVNVQIKTGSWFKVTYKKHPMEARFSLRVASKDSRAWAESNVPTIVVWVDISNEIPEFYWRSSAYVSAGKTRLPMKSKNKIDVNAIPHLLALARTGTLEPSLFRITEPLLAHHKVAYHKNLARSYFESWRTTGSINPVLGKVLVTLRFWRHITRRSLPQATICYRLMLLSCGRQLVEHSTAIRQLRSLNSDGKVVDLIQVSGKIDCSWRCPGIIDVILERFYLGYGRCGSAQYRIYSIFERRNIKS